MVGVVDGAWRMGEQEGRTERMMTRVRERERERAVSFGACACCAAGDEKGGGAPFSTAREACVK